MNLHTNSYLLIYINDENPKAIYYNKYARDKITHGKLMLSFRLQRTNVIYFSNNDTDIHKKTRNHWPNM